MTELTTPPKDDLKFTANGKTYFIESRISIARRMECDKLLIEITGGGNMGENFNDWRKVYDLCNDKKFADIAVLAHNRMEGVKKWKERHDPVLAICALFINEENEDRRFITDETIKAKIRDWQEAGIEYDFFSKLAEMLLQKLIVNWKSIFPNTSAAESK